MSKILFATSEMLPLIKTGGLADVAGALPAALAALGEDVRVAMPAYRGILGRMKHAREIGALKVQGDDFGVWEGRLDDGGPIIWLLQNAALYEREGDPYHDRSHQPWPDNAIRFGRFCQALAQLSRGEVAAWRPDIVHANDWQTGLVGALLSGDGVRPRTVFTIHNLAYQGNYGRDRFDALGLPPRLWSVETLEFHGNFSFMKAGITCSDAVTTVSPGYAREILTAEFGHGLEGVMRAQAHKLSGILNGIDEKQWDPSRDPLIAQPYDAATLVTGKLANKRALQARLGLHQGGDAPLVGLIGRLAWQKGSDVVLAAVPRLLDLGVQLAVLGSGEASDEATWRAWARLAPGRVGVHIGYEEGLAHLIEAGADLFLMPSRFEPCGLNQMYSQRYGTIPVVRRVGGLADTVIDITPENLAAGTATGVLFEHADSGGVTWAVGRALELRQDAKQWHAMQLAGMKRDFSWRASAQVYQQLYLDLLRGRHRVR